MAVYFNNEDSGKHPFSTYGIIDLLGKYLINPAIQRSAEAKRVVQGREALAEQRSYAEGQSRMQAEQKAAADAQNLQGFLGGAQQSGLLPPGMAETLAYGARNGMNLKDLQGYFTPVRATHDLDDRVIATSRNPFETGTEEYTKGLSLYNKGQLDNKQTELGIQNYAAVQKADSDRTKATASMITANRGDWVPLDATDSNGNALYQNKHNADIRTSEGINAKPGKGMSSKDITSSLAALIKMTQGVQDGIGGTTPLPDDMLAKVNANIQQLLAKQAALLEPRNANGSGARKGVGAGFELREEDIVNKAVYEGVAPAIAIQEAKDKGYTVIPRGNIKDNFSALERVDGNHREK